MEGKFTRTLLSCSLLASLLAFGVFFYAAFFSKRSLPNENEERDKLLQDSRTQGYPDSYRLDRLVVNLKSPATRLRFLDIQMYIVPFVKGKHRLLSKHEPQIYDAVNRIGGEMASEELNSIHGKIIFENRIKKEINQILQEKVVKEIQYSKFIVQ